MTVKVIKAFTDKHTGKFHDVGDLLEVDKKRLDEILSVDKLVEKVAEKKG